MASLHGLYHIEPRPCYVYEPSRILRRKGVKQEPRKALFHCWTHESNVVEPSLLKGGHPGGTVATTLALVELEDGKVMKTYPECIEFCDEKIKDYAFPEKGVDTADDIEDGDVHDASGTNS